MLRPHHPHAAEPQHLNNSSGLGNARKEGVEGIKCPFCGHLDTKVLDSRETDNGAVTRRRRECLKCEKRFTTYEHIEMELMVVKKDGKREPFDRNKLRLGLVKACEKRPISMEKIDAMTSEIEADLVGKEAQEIKSTMIGELVMKKLKKVDKVAYIRFASVYREFADLTSFKKEVEKLLVKK
jgi:transcriptional repressor NrdR